MNDEWLGIKHNKGVVGADAYPEPNPEPAKVRSVPIHTS